MIYRALRSFSGLVSMVEGQESEISDKSVAEDLLRCGYIEEITPAEEVKTPKATKRKTPKGA